LYVGNKIPDARHLTNVEKEAAVDLLVVLQIVIRPFAGVQKISKGALHVFEHSAIGCLNLVGIDGDFAVQFLADGTKRKETEKHYRSESNHACIP
jgi:hypothetical protein